MSTDDIKPTEVLWVTMPICSHGFRSGYAYAIVDGVKTRLFVSRAANTSYWEHVQDTTTEFATGKGEVVTK